MPFKSKAQQRWMFAAEERGEVPKGTAKRWADKTPSIKKLPEKKKKKAMDKKAANARLINYLEHLSKKAADGVKEAEAKRVQQLLSLMKETGDLAQTLHRFAPEKSAEEKLKVARMLANGAIMHEMINSKED